MVIYELLLIILLRDESFILFAAISQVILVSDITIQILVM